MTNIHIPVLQKEILKYLDPKPNQNFIDCTIGGGGHSAAILEKIAPRGKILGIDRDSEILKAAKFKIQKHAPYRTKGSGTESKVKNNLILVCDNFSNLKKIVETKKFRPVAGILFDLGMSSWHLEESRRGFSFLRNELLDMRYSPENPLSAEKIVNYWSKFEIERILKEFGEEKFARKIAEKIIEERKIKPIKTTTQLVEIIKKAAPSWYQHSKIHFATRTFQALRIAVNDELNNLEKALSQALTILKPGGRIAVISFHSLEDRIIKNFYKEQSSVSLKILTKKPIRPLKEEIKNNPRSRSAKLRAVELLPAKVHAAMKLVVLL